MTAPTPEPEHSGIRPLGPYGEGYCRVCHFVEPLNYDGRIAQHSRNTSYQPTECKGSYTKPPKITPLVSRLAMFRVKAPDVWCPECKQYVHSTTQGGVPVYARHSRAVTVPRTVPVMCPYTMRRVERDQNNTRG